MDGWVGEWINGYMDKLMTDNMFDFPSGSDG